MNYDQMLFQVLQEECAEVIQASSKINRFGLEDYHPGKRELGTNEARFVQEAHDLLAVLQMINDRYGLCIGEGFKAELAIEDKKKKVIEYLAYSRRSGTLDGSVPEKLIK